MQAITLSSFAQQAPVKTANPAKAIARKEATQKILLFIAIIACVVLAVNI